MSTSLNCIVLIAFVKLSLYSHSVYSTVIVPATATIDTLVQDYLNEEKHLWHLVRSTEVNHNDNLLLHIYDTHRDFLSHDFYETGSFDAFAKQDRPVLLEHRVMERGILRVTDTIHNVNVTTLNTIRILNISEYEKMPNLMRDILKHQPKLISILIKYTDPAMWNFLKNNSQFCSSSHDYVLSENQALLHFYNEIIAALLKSYMMLQMTFMIYTVDNLDSSIEISRFYQGYIDNEVNLNEEGHCRHTCDEFIETKHYQCADGSFCKGLGPQLQTQLICTGTVRNCQYIHGNLNICPTKDVNSTSRYEFIKNDDGNMFGDKTTTNCHSNSMRSNSWWSWLVHCSNCLCFCDEPGQYSDRYFSLRPVLSNTDENKVISGIALTKYNRMIQLRIAEKELLPNGRLNNVPTKNGIINNWHTAKPFSIDDLDAVEGVDFHTISCLNRSIDLDTVVDADRIVTGVRFRVVNSHLRLKVRVTNFNYQTGELIDIQRSEWIYDNSTAEKQLFELHSADRSTRSKQKSIPIHPPNHYINFQPSDFLKDAAQSTIPFIGTTPIESSTPLSGLGLYWKGNDGFGGFIAPSLIVFDQTIQIKPINNF